MEHAARSMQRKATKVLDDQLGFAASLVREPVQAEFKNKKQFAEVLQNNRYGNVDFNVEDVIDMLAELRGISRARILHEAVTTWFEYGTGCSVSEVDCHEHPCTEELEDRSGLLVFRIGLKSKYEYEVAMLKEDETLKEKYSAMVKTALPKEVQERRKDKLDQMLQISYTKEADDGTVELGGVASISLMVLIVAATSLSACTCDACSCSQVCSCLTRQHHQAVPFFCTMSDLQCRGAEFQVNRFGGSSAVLKVGPVPWSKWRCAVDCFVM
eukprot:TRINITY_DN9975_c0_g1_i1.p1 TRINITY_DN9975_c0_g1~~TRINITY_DN9975_c0_g1_i1.p1  ORF type:complete len:270 (+),score=57.65 TRINITY_DN9975_c0_g1_i1:104-913(+)